MSGLTLTKQVIAFDTDNMVTFLKELFEGEDFAYTLKPDRVYVRLSNLNSFSVYINNERQTLDIEVRRKYTSIEPDFKKSLYINFDMDFVFRRLIKYNLDELNGLTTTHKGV